MIHVSIVIPQGGTLLNSVARIFKIFDQANCYLTGNGRELLFDIHLAGSTAPVDLYGGLFTVDPDLTMAECFETDLVIIPSLAGNIAEVLKNNTACIQWIKKQYQMGAEIAGLCTGAFLLAGTGLADDPGCTARWFVAPGFREEFSQINLLAEKIIIHEEAIRTDGGAYSFITLLLEKSAGRDVALASSKIFETEFNRECQSLVTILNGDPKGDRVIKPRTRFMEDHSAGKLSMEKFVEMFKTKQANGKGNFKKANMHVFNECVHNVKAGAAGKRPAAGCENVVAKNIEAYNNTRIFKELFKKITGL